MEQRAKVSKTNNNYTGYTVSWKIEVLLLYK